MELGLSSSDFSAATVQPSRQFGIIALFFAFVYYSLLWYRSVFKFLDLSKFHFRPLPPQAVPLLQRRRQEKNNYKLQKRDVEGTVPYGFYITPRYVVTRDVEGAVPYDYKKNFPFFIGEGKRGDNESHNKKKRFRFRPLPPQAVPLLQRRRQEKNNASRKKTRYPKSDDTSILPLSSLRFMLFALFVYD